MTMTHDKEIFGLIKEELERQRRGLELIASENFTSLQVMPNPLNRLPAGCIRLPEIR